MRETSDRERQRAVAKTAEARSRRNERLRARRATDPEWCERERRRARERKYRMRYGMPTTALGDLEGWICYLCCEHVEPADAEPDHIIPESRGGTSDRANLGLTHRHCNRRKQDATVASLEWAHPSAVERERAAIAFALATVSP